MEIMKEKRIWNKNKTVLIKRKRMRIKISRTTRINRSRNLKVIQNKEILRRKRRRRMLQM